MLGIFVMLVYNPPKMLLCSEVLQIIFDTKTSFLWIFRCQCKTYIYVYIYIYTVNLEKVVHEQYIKIYLTRDYKYISHMTRHVEYIKLQM